MSAGTRLVQGMGDKNQLHFLKARIPAVDGPVLEVGSKKYGFNVNFRDVYHGEYVGVDMAEGDGVDEVVDLSKTLGPLPEKHFSLVICCSVLEHVEQPYAMADNLVRLLRPGGRIYVSVPWTWRYHAYPADYWRFSWQGIQKLFPSLAWEEPMFSTTRDGELFPAVPDADNNLATVIEGRKFIPYLMLHMVSQ